MNARRRHELPTRSALTRRALMLAAVAGDVAFAQDIRPEAVPTRNEEEASITVRRLVGDAQPQRGRIRIELPDIAESGNSVPLKVNVESPMSADDHVRLIHVVAERNPRPWVATYSLGPRAGKAEVETHIRLRDSQAVAVYAQMSDGSWWIQRRDVTVIIGACESLPVRY